MRLGAAPALSIAGAARVFVLAAIVYARMARRRQRQGILGFDYEAVSSTEEVTSHAGLALVLEAMRALGVDRSVERHLARGTRRKGFGEARLVEAIVLLLCAGGDSMDDMQVLGADAGLLRLLDVPKLPSPDAVREFLLRFHDPRCIEQARAELRAGECALVVPDSKALRALGSVVRDVVDAMQRLDPKDSATIEADATIVESDKAAALPHYDGGRGYQPLIAYWVEQDVVVADQFRDGNVPCSKRPLDVVRAAFATVPASVTKRRFRADSAFYGHETIAFLSDPAQRIERFTLSAPVDPILRERCERVDDWKLYEDRGHETVYVSEVDHVVGDLPKSAPALRTIVLKIDRRQRDLFGAKYLAIVSNDFQTEAAELVRWHYMKAGAIERVNDVVKNDLGGGGMPCQQFGANAAWWRLNLLAYNVLGFLRKMLPPRFERVRAKKLRFAIFDVPGRVLTHARRFYVRIAEWYDQLGQWTETRARLLRAALVLSAA